MTIIEALSKLERMRDWPQDYDFDDDEIQALRLASIALSEKLTEQKKLVIIRAKIKLDTVALQYYRDKFKKEYEEGLIVLPEYFEVTVHDVIRDVKIEGGST